MMRGSAICFFLNLFVVNRLRCLLSLSFAFWHGPCINTLSLPRRSKPSRVATAGSRQINLEEEFTRKGHCHVGFNTQA
ncbi:hypothetical protein Pla52o_47760 [Novipirellula galeiformis]|uniref:Uncharacterized protein n=1 Tax=Novipirellula galeiformis TaxID=2528004 RepID=A0A5C6C6J9_9BACT|nr:hypothetical protein Pla52o_47760 [Novipirellula galeiformis]